MDFIECLIYGKSYATIIIDNWICCIACLTKYSCVNMKKYIA